MSMADPAGVAMEDGVGDETRQLGGSAGYRAVVGLLACGLVALALLYGALLAFLGWLVVWHAIETFATWSYGPYFVYHVPMALLGGLLLAFLVKPLFGKRERGKEVAVALTREKEPKLFDYIDKLCERTGARRPTVVEVDLEPNAAAVSKSILGMARGEMTLRIGLPLVAALSRRQLAGVIGHELGHFRQRKGIFASQLIRRMNFFFTRIVFERDALDRALHKIRGKGNDVFRKAAFGVAWLPVEGARGVLWLMLLAAESLSSWALRAMEFDADEVEAGLAGPEDFARTGRTLVALGFARQSVRDDLSWMYSERRLPDDIAMIVAHRAREAERDRADLISTIENRPARWLDSHPSNAARVARVRSLGLGASLPEGGSGPRLFSDFGALCRETTKRLYRIEIEGELDATKLVDSRTAVAELALEEKAIETLRRYLRRLHTWLSPVMPGPDCELPVKDPGEAAEKLIELRARIAEADEFPKLTNTWIELQGRKARVAGEQVLGRALAGFTVAAQINRGWQADDVAIANELRLVEGRIKAFWATAAERLDLGLSLAHTPGVLPEAEAMELLEQGPALFELCRSLQAHRKVVVGLRDSQVKLRVLLSACGERVPMRLHQEVLRATAQVREALEDMRLTLGQLRYPFAHGKQEMTVGMHLVPELPEEDEPVPTFRASERAAGAAEALVARAVARLAAFAEAAELAVGLSPMGEPPESQMSEGMSQRVREEEKREAAGRRKYWRSYSARAGGGVVMLALLVGLSVAPPTLPAMPWSSGDAAGYRPAGFNVHVASYVAPPVYVGDPNERRNFRGPVQIGGQVDPRSPVFQPGRGIQPAGTPPPPGSYHPGTPNNPQRSPWSPTRTPGVPTPGFPSNPRPSVPSLPSGGGYRPPSPGGGGGGGGFHGGGGGGHR